MTFFFNSKLNEAQKYIEHHSTWPFQGLFYTQFIYFEKVGLEEIEKCKIAIFQHQILNLETSIQKVVKNIWSTEGIFLSKIIEFIRQIKKLEFCERSTKNQGTENLRHCQQP